MYVPHGGAEVKEIGSETGGMFFILSLPLVADIEMELRAARQDSKRSESLVGAK